MFRLIYFLFLNLRFMYTSTKAFISIFIGLFLDFNNKSKTLHRFFYSFTSEKSLFYGPSMIKILKWNKKQYLLSLT